MSNQVEATETFSRLPTNVVPSHYFIEIIPDLPTFTFAGSETVNVDVREKTSSIVLNALDLEIQSASFVSNGEEQPSTSIELKKKEEVAIISFANELSLGLGQLKLKFTGEINDHMKGCYRSKYTTPEGELRYGLSTQFESVYCRKAFPCWDEPALKAKFDLTLVAPKDRVALSNMPVVEEKDYELDNSKKVIKYGTTPIMSTYLLCYVVGEYEYIEKITKNNTKIRMYTGVGKTDQGKFALDVSVRCLEFYEEYFKIPFPLPKVDLIAISEFNAGAMENWGLITYRETCVLFDPLNTDSHRKQWIAIVVCHELAHQWFGNLVTMEWWTHLWLNEGFASFMENFSCDILFPEFNIWEQFSSKTLTTALNLDALHNSHPIEVPVNNPSEIEEIFDMISYMKGASVIRMLYLFIGNDDFQKGMNLYLNKFAYKNTFTEDLWDCLEEASKKPIRSIMSSWTRQKGFPVITVTSRQDGSNRILSLSQEKFSIDGVLTEKDQQSKWLIPLNIISQNNQKPVKILMENRTQEVVLENIEPTEWVKLNSGMTTVCRINYPVEAIEQFQKSIAAKTLSTTDRLNIQGDLFALVKSGKMSSDRILKSWENYIDETEYPVWDSIIGSLAKFNKLLDYTDYQEVFHLYVRKILSKVFSVVGVKSAADENHQIGLLRTVVFSLLTSVKDPQILQEAKSMFDSHVAKISHISPNLRASVYRSVAGGCDDKAYESLFQLYRETDLQEEKNRIAFSLGATSSVSRIQRAIDFAMSDEVKNQDATRVLCCIASSNKVAREIVWNYYKQHHEVFYKKYDGGQMLSDLVELTENFASLDKLQEVEEFFAAHPIPNAERTVKQSLESIKSNADWLARDSANIKNYLTSSS